MEASLSSSLFISTSIFIYLSLFTLAPASILLLSYSHPNLNPALVPALAPALVPALVPAPTSLPCNYFDHRERGPLTRARCMCAIVGWAKGVPGLEPGSPVATYHRERTTTYLPSLDRLYPNFPAVSSEVIVWACLEAALEAPREESTTASPWELCRVAVARPTPAEPEFHLT